MELLNELKQIFNEKGVNGLLPQNLPDELINEFAKKLVEFTEFNYKYGKIIDESFIATPCDDTIRSINFLIVMFTRTTIEDNSYESNIDDFNNGLICIRHHYIAEHLRRMPDIKLKKLVLTVEMILDKKYLDKSFYLK